MSVPCTPEVVFTGPDDTAQTTLPLASEGVARYVWEGRFGPMLIEVRDGCAFVNGEPVEPLLPDPVQARA